MCESAITECECLRATEVTGDKFRAFEEQKHFRCVAALQRAVHAHPGRILVAHNQKKIKEIENNFDLFL